MRTERRRECTAEQGIRESLRLRKIPVRRLLTELEIPQAVIHNVRIKHIRADVKGIVRLNALKKRRVPVLHNLS